MLAPSRKAPRWLLQPPCAESRRGAGMTPTPVLRLGSSPLLLGSTLGDGACAILRPHARRENTSASPLSQEWARDASMCIFLQISFPFRQICNTCMRPFTQPLDLDWAEPAPARAIQCLIGRKAGKPSCQNVKVAGLRQFSLAPKRPAAWDCVAEAMRVVNSLAL